MPIRAHFATLPTGNTNAVVPILFIGPSTKLLAEPEVAVEPAFIVRIFPEEQNTTPFVSVKVPFTLVELFKVTPVPLVLFIVRLEKPVEFVPPIDCAAVPKKATSPA